MEIREALQRGEDGEWDVTDKEFIYSSPQLLFHGHYSVLREALRTPPPPHLFICLTQKLTDSKPGLTRRAFLPLLIQNTAKLLDQVKPNRSAGAGLGRNVTGARPLWQVLRWGKTWRGGSRICVSQEEVEKAGDAVAKLL